MQTVYFHDKNGNKRELGKAERNEQSKVLINEFLDEHGYVSSYWRFWENNEGNVTVDVGSHTEHFTIESSEKGESLIDVLLNKKEPQKQEKKVVGRGSVNQELNTVKDLIIHTLKHKPATRNSDTLLYLETCKYMGAETIDDMMALNLNIITVHKIRQVVQNKEGLYLPDENVKSERKRRTSEIRDYMSRLKGVKK